MICPDRDRNKSPPQKWETQNFPAPSALSHIRDWKGRERAPELTLKYPATHIRPFTPPVVMVERGRAIFQKAYGPPGHHTATLCTHSGHGTRPVSRWLLSSLLCKITFPVRGMPELRVPPSSPVSPRSLRHRVADRYGDFVRVTRRKKQPQQGRRASAPPLNYLSPSVTEWPWPLGHHPSCRRNTKTKGPREWSFCYVGQKRLSKLLCIFPKIIRTGCSAGKSCAKPIAGVMMFRIP